jgi:uncharacterized protein (DUF1810 family)
MAMNTPMITAASPTGRRSEVAGDLGESVGRDTAASEISDPPKSIDWVSRRVAMADRFNLERFVRAQEDGATYEHAADELRSGHKRSHWMWFVFPQIAGLGQSPTSKWYAISSLEEAKAYLMHPVLGPRLLECSGIVATIVDKSAAQIFGGLDAQKLRSSMTLFLRADPDEPIFQQVLDRHFEGLPDPATGALL